MIHYSDSEVSVFHPICENALNKAIRSLGLASTYRAVHHRHTGSLEMDYVIENVTTGKYLCVIEVKRTPADVNSTRYQMQAMSYVQSNTGMNERTFYFLTNLEYSYAFRYDASRPRPFQQMLLPGLNHIANFSVDDENVVTNKLAAYFASYLNDFISDTYTYMLTLETFAANMEPLKAMPREWKSHLAIYFYEFIRGSFNYIHRTDLRDVRLFGHDVSKICAEASRVNFKGIYDYSVTSFTPTVSVTNIDLVNLYELGQQNVTGDSIANVLHSIVSSGHEHDGEVATDLELGRIVAALAKDEIGTLAPSDIVCDPAAGSGNLISAAIDLMNLQPTQILANDINTKLIELLTLRIGLNFANIISKTNSPTVSCEDICNLSPSFFSRVKLILMNPPYVAGINCVSRKQPFYQKILSLTGAAPKTEIGQMPLESVFLELITELVAPGTVVACVFPSTQLSAKGKEAIATREMLLDSFGLRTIFMYPDNDIFDAVAKSTCVLIGRVKQPANDVRIISSYTSIPDIDEGMFSHAIKQSLFNGFTSIMPGVDAKKISISDMRTSVLDGWKMLNRELEEGQNFINTNFASSTRFSLVGNLTTKLKRGPAGNKEGSDLLFINKNKPLYDKYLPLGLSVAPGMCNSKYDSFVVGMGDTQCLDERINSPTLVNSIIADYISLVSTGGKQQKKVKSALEWLDIVKAESLKSFPAHSVLIPRGTRKDGSIYYADTITFVSTNFFVLPFANQRDAILSATWMSTVFYQVMVEVNCKNQEGMRKMEKTEINNTYVPVFSTVSASTYTDLLAEIGTLEFVDLHHPIVRDVDRIWANELFGANANTMLDEAVRILTYLADVRDQR